MPIDLINSLRFDFGRFATTMVSVRYRMAKPRRTLQKVLCFTHPCAPSIFFDLDGRRCRPSSRGRVAAEVVAHGSVGGVIPGPCRAAAAVAVAVRVCSPQRPSVRAAAAALTQPKPAVAALTIGVPHRRIVLAGLAGEGSGSDLHLVVAVAQVLVDRKQPALQERFGDVGHL